MLLLQLLFAFVSVDCRWPTGLEGAAASNTHSHQRAGRGGRDSAAEQQTEKDSPRLLCLSRYFCRGLTGLLCPLLIRLCCHETPAIAFNWRGSISLLLSPLVSPAALVSAGWRGFSGAAAVP